MKRCVNIVLTVMLVLLTAAAVALFVIRPSVLDHQRQLSEERLLRGIEGGELEYASLSVPALADEDAVFGELGLGGAAGEGETFSLTCAGTLSIPSIDLEMPVAVGTDASILRVALGWYPKSAEIGAEGNCVIFGRHLGRYGRHFNRLDELKQWDTVTVTNGEGERFDYLVTDSVVVLPEELPAALAEWKGGSTLTLVTDLGSGEGSHRLVVYAEPDTSVG